jgi:hypothetical protein
VTLPGLNQIKAIFFFLFPVFPKSFLVGGARKTSVEQTSEKKCDSLKHISGSVGSMNGLSLVAGVSSDGTK